MEKRFPRPCPPVIVNDLGRRRKGISDRRDMRGNGYSGLLPERMSGRQRLLAKNIEQGPGQMARTDGGEEIFLDKMFASGDVDQVGAGRKPAEKPVIKDVPGRRRQRQETDEDIGLRQHRRQAVLAVVTGDWSRCLRSPAPTVDGESEGS